MDESVVFDMRRGGGIILAAYINSFKEAFTVLSVSMSEDITVENIFAGMRPAHFSRLSFKTNLRLLLIYIAWR